MGYKYRNGSTPDHVDSSDSDANYPHTGDSEQDPKPKPKMNLSDSLDKYEGKMRESINKGDVKGTREAAKKYAGFDEQYTQNAINNQIKVANANADSAKKYGAHEAAVQGKLQEGGGHMYGAEEVDTTAAINAAKGTAEKKKNSRQTINRAP